MEKKLVIEPKKFRGETSVVSVRLPVEIADQIDVIASNTNRTKNEIITMMLDFALENMEAKN